MKFEDFEESNFAFKGLESQNWVIQRESMVDFSP
jgi:hypothetical protein